MDNVSTTKFLIRPAQKSDCASIHRLICELAEYERMLDQVEITAEQLAEDGFGHGHSPLYHAFVVEKQSEPSNPVIVGFLLHVFKYSTFKGPFLWVEDFYIQPEYRRMGLGQQLFSTVVRKAHKLKMPRIEWNVLGWNKLAREFYHGKLNAIDQTHREDWLTYRLPKEGFEPLLKRLQEDWKKIDKIKIEFQD